MSDYPMSTDGRPLGKDRSPWAVLGLMLITIGIYFLVWYYKVNREMRDHDERIEVKPGLAVLCLFVPIVSLVSMFNTAKRLQQIQAMEGLETSCSPGLALILALFTGGIGYPAYMASLLRRHWQIHQQGFAAADYAPYGAIGQGGHQALPHPGQSGYAQLPESYQHQAQGEQLSPDGRYRWDGQAWQLIQQPQQPQQTQPVASSGAGEQLSEDGRYRWDGQAWQPVQPPQPQHQPQPQPQPQQPISPAQDQPAAAAEVQPAWASSQDAEQLSPDGRYRWDGAAWQPVQQQAERSPAAAAEQLSPDGRYRWDGQAWQPVQVPAQPQAHQAPHPQSFSEAAEVRPPEQFQAPPVATQQIHPPQPAVQEMQPHSSAADAGGQLSPDGRYRWDGHNWQLIDQ